jgi:hypothetical protein|nr:MAG TPA: hypothetical protein [Caudoviricetes sp.]
MENSLREKINLANIQLSEIAEIEPDVANAITLVIDHVRGTYGDKYAKGITKGIDTKQMLYDAEKGDLLNVYQISRYAQRYITDGSEKSHLIKDLFKMCHYAIFEIVRRVRGGAQIIEPKN